MKRKPQYLIIFEHIIQQIYTGKITIGDRLDSIKACQKNIWYQKYYKNCNKNALRKGLYRDKSWF